jgi:hypothetical protein
MNGDITFFASLALFKQNSAWLHSAQTHFCAAPSAKRVPYVVFIFAIRPPDVSIVTRELASLDSFAVLLFYTCTHAVLQCYIPSLFCPHLISSHLISSHLITSHLISSHLITSHLIFSFFLILSTSPPPLLSISPSLHLFTSPSLNISTSPSFRLSLLARSLQTEQRLATLGTDTFLRCAERQARSLCRIHLYDQTARRIYCH